MDAHLLNLFLILGAHIEEDVLHRWCLLFARGAGVNCGPPEDAFDDAFRRVDVDALGRRDLVVAASVALQVDVSVGGDVVNKVADLIGVCFDHHLVGSVGIDHSNYRSVGVDDVFVDVRADVVQPQLLPAAFESGWACVIEVSFEEFLGSFIENRLLCHCTKIPAGAAEITLAGRIDFNKDFTRRCTRE